jgi:hypothetical protein
VTSSSALFPFSLSLFHQTWQRMRQHIWKRRQEMPENGRISGPPSTLAVNDDDQGAVERAQIPLDRLFCSGRIQGSLHL